MKTLLINVTGQQIDVGDALRGHIEDAIEATTEKYFADAIEANVVLSRESYRIRASIAMHVGRGIHVRAQEEADEAYAAFDVALAHLAKAASPQQAPAARPSQGSRFRRRRRQHTRNTSLRRRPKKKAKLSRPKTTRSLSQRTRQSSKT